MVVHQTYINERSYERSGVQLPPPSDRGGTVRRLLKVEKVGDEWRKGSWRGKEKQPIDTTNAFFVFRLFFFLS